MKKKRIILTSILLVVIISIITIYNELTIIKNSNNKITIKAYINGKLASAPPSSTDGYKVSNIACTNGATGIFNYSTWRLEMSNVTSNTMCTINFVSNNNTSFATYLKNKVCSSTPTSDSAAQNCLVNENGYRYEGSDPNNYVLFNNELWRIIGVFNVQNSAGTSGDLVKLIREEQLDKLSWDGNCKNNWSTATLQTQLNNGYLNATDTTCNVFSVNSVTKTCKFSEIGLKLTARNMIESVVWTLGAIGSSDTPDAMYTAERGNSVYSGNPLTWTGKVGLMYPSDYGYAVLASNCSRGTKLSSYNYSSPACPQNNWLYKYGKQWVLTHILTSSSEAYQISFSGEISYMLGMNSTCTNKSVRPTIYLKSNIKYMSGSGTYSDPYIIS